MPHLLISAAHKSSGKTTITIGLAAALSRQGVAVQPFKKGPDYIDPLWLSHAAGRPCRNLDFHTMSESEIAATFNRHAAVADLALVEGNKGLFDGVDPEGSDSNAALATLLGSPVLLVLDTRGMTRGIAPLLFGYCAFDPAIRIAGVILNQVGGPRHEAKLRAALERYTDVPVLGAVARDPDLEIPERHLGLLPANEAESADRQVARLADAIAAQVDLAKVREVAATAPALPTAPARPAVRRPPDVRIAIARDAAFAFYYPDDLEALAAAGAELVPFDTLRDSALPDVDGLLIGGGFPETQTAALEANVGLRRQIRTAIGNGLPTYAECGGLMYLARGIQWNGRSHAMVGAIPGDIVVGEKPQGRGYVLLEETGRSPWPVAPDAGTAGDRRIRAHEFHYSALENLQSEPTFAYRVLRGHGIDGRHDGIVVGNLLASFCHLRDLEGCRWTERFVGFVRSCKQGRAVRQPASAARTQNAR